MKRTKNKPRLLKKIEKLKDKYFRPTQTNSSSPPAVEDFLAKSGRWPDETYLTILKNGLQLDGTPILGRDRRFWQMIQFLKAVQHLGGETVEAGCRFGLSSYIICHYERLAKADYSGATHHIFDSFKGLSQPVDNDFAGRGTENQIMMKMRADYKEPQDSFLERTQTTLQEFPRINYYVGWIPEVFAEVEKTEYKFVHLDLDLFEPTYHALEFFYPQLVSGGCLVIDDYGFPKWPGAKLAADQWAKENNCHVIPFLTGNAVIIKSS